MQDFLHKFKMALADTGLRNRIFFVIAALVIFRLLANIPIPAATGAGLEQLLGNSNFLGFLNILTGGGLKAISIVMLGVGPYITASIIMQLSTIMSERLKALYHEEGELGRKKFTQYSRLLTVPLAILQGYGLLFYLQAQGVLGDMGLIDVVINISIVVAGSMLLMWIGELISEFGIGNGVSLIIFAGIVASLPKVAGQILFTFTPAQIPLYLGFAIAAFVIIAGIVTMTEAERPVPITYAKQVRGNKVYGGISTYLPLRINQAGVIPIIFALSILVFPQALFNILAGVQNEFVSGIAGVVSGILSNQIIFPILYFLLVFLFTYFYTAVTVDPEAISNNLQKSGAFIPGVRPGNSTAEYISRVISRITMVGAIFLGIVAILPFAMIAITGNQALAIGGTALLIAVSVVLDLIKKIDAQVSMREY